MRAIRRLLTPYIRAEYNRALVRMAHNTRPDLFFVFKGEHVTPQTMEAIKALGTIAIQFYPDVSFRTHGPNLPQTLPLYDWVFTTKSFGLADMGKQLGIHKASFLPHGFDPETHTPSLLTPFDRRQYEADVSFIGNWSLKKERVLEYVMKSASDAKLKIWGPKPWQVAQKNLLSCFENYPVLGLEYAKSIQVSKINIAILSEARTGASSGDLITARTFEIPAAGGFMLHERTDEAMAYFEDGKECAFYSDPDDLVAKIRYYLAHEDERKAVAKAGRARCLSSGYSVDDRVKTMLKKYCELRKGHNI